MLSRSSGYRRLIFVLFYIYGSAASAQLTTQDSIVLKLAEDHAVTSYHSLLFPETALYNGVEYVPFPNLLRESHAFFKSPTFKTGNLSFNGIVYNNVPLLYDVIQQVLIVGQSEGFIKLQLEGELVQWFTVSDQYFTRLDKDSSVSGFPGAGFYAVLYSGNLALLKKESKTIIKNVSVEGIDWTAAETGSYYVFKNNRYDHIRNKKSLLNILSDRKKEIRQFMRRNKLDLKGNDNDQALLKIITYYDRLNKQ